MNHLLPLEGLLQILAVSFLGSLAAHVIASYVGSKIKLKYRAESGKLSANDFQLAKHIALQKIGLLIGPSASLANVKSDLQGLDSSVLNSSTNSVISSISESNI